MTNKDIKGDKLIIMTMNRKNGLPVMLVYEFKASDLLNCRPVVLLATVDIHNLESYKVITARWNDDQFYLVVSQTVGDEKDQHKRVRVVRVRLDEEIMEAKTTFSPVQSTKDFPRSENHSADIEYLADKILVKMLTDRAVVYKIFEKDMRKSYPTTIVKSKHDYRLFSAYHNLISSYENLSSTLFSMPDQAA